MTRFPFCNPRDILPCGPVMNGREGWRNMSPCPVLLFLIFAALAVVGMGENMEGNVHPLTFDQDALPWAGDDAGGNLMRDEYLAAPAILGGARAIEKPCGLMVVEVEGCR